MSNTAPRPRVIERWFPCAEVSAASTTGWGSANSETLLFTWFAKRPLAQARAAVLCSLLPWPDEEAEQEHIQAVIKESLGTCIDPNYIQERNGYAPRPHAHGIRDCARYDKQNGYNAARRDVVALLAEHYPQGADILDPFSGRGLLPLEGARYGVQAHAIDYSPVATLASKLLIDYPFRDWTREPHPPGDRYDPSPWQSGRDPRLVVDVRYVLDEIQRRWADKMAPYYPDNAWGEKPWGYLWASTMPCAECGRTFPLFGSSELRRPKGSDPGQGLRITTKSDTWTVEVVDGLGDERGTLRQKPGTKRNKLAWCPFPDCGHGHPIRVHQRLSSANFNQDAMLAVADITQDGSKVFREPTDEERAAAAQATDDLHKLRLPSGLPAKPDEIIAAGNAHSVGGLLYGAVTYGDLSNDRQNLAHALLCATMNEITQELLDARASQEYAAALAGYVGSVLVRKLRRSSRGARLDVGRSGVGDVFVNEAGIGYNYDYFEAGIGDGPGTWSSVQRLATLERQAAMDAKPARVTRGSALSLAFATQSLDAVVTDPPYGDMVEYADSSDFFYAWLKRLMAPVDPAFSVTANPDGTQEKDEEIIVLRMASGLNDHRTEEFYQRKITDAFAECRRVVKTDGVISIVFGHNDPEVWRQLLTAIDQAGLVLTGSWPAKTEKGGSAGSANIVSTLTLACRPAPTGRPDGRVSEVDAEVRRVVAERVKNLWDPAGLAVDDQLMAAAGPAMEVVGRYERVLDKKGQPVDISRYLPLARRAVEDAQDIRLDSLPLATFDARTRFGLFWARLHGRRTQAASEAGWQRLAADLEERDTEGVVTPVSKGVRLAYADEAAPTIVDGSPILDVALAAAHGWRTGSLANAAGALRASGRDPDDPHLWACINALSKALPESDRDGEVFTRMVRNREGVVAAARNVEAAELAEAQRAEDDRRKSEANPVLFEDPNSLFGQEGNGR